MSRHSSSRSSAPTIVLYDLPAQTSQAWSPNIWRIRFILNYKRLRYRTHWVDFPDVEMTLRSIGAAPSSIRSDGRAIYSLPVLVDPTRNPMAPDVLSNTTLIAEYLESAYPQRPVYPPGSRAMQSLFVHYIQEVMAKPLLPLMIPASHSSISHRSRAHLSQSPSGGGRMSLSGPQREQAFQAVREQFDFLSAILAKNVRDGDGIVAMGRDLSYADFALCSILIWIEQMSPTDLWPRLRTWNGGRWNALWERCRPYMEIH